MKRITINSVLLFLFCLMSQIGLAQEKVDITEDPIKDELIKTYSWTKAFFENTAEPVVYLSEMENESGHQYVLIESKNAKTLYDTNGKQYCADHSELSCVEYYKLSEGKLSWKNPN